MQRDAAYTVQGHALQNGDQYDCLEMTDTRLTEAIKPKRKHGLINCIQWLRPPSRRISRRPRKNAA